MDTNTIVGLDFLITGLVVATLGYIGVQSIPIAAFGFAVAIIGALILLIVPEPIPQDAYKALLKDSIANIEIILEESQMKEKAYFLRIEDEVRAFIPIPQVPSIVQTSSELQNLQRAPRRFITSYRNLRGLTLVPPGNEIVKLAKLQREDEVEESLRSTLITFSDLATSVLSIEEGNQIKIQIGNPKLTSESPFFNDCLGSPLSCVACCVVASVKGSPIRIIDEKFDKALIRLTLEIMAK